MVRKKVRQLRPGFTADPFGERTRQLHRERARLLGCVFDFECSSNSLLRLVQAAYAGLPRHHLPGDAPRLRIRLQLTPADTIGSSAAPPPPLIQGGAGLLTGVVNAGNFAVIHPADRTGLVAISRSMLRCPYYARYELLEFAVFTLAHRGGGLVSLHAGCVGWQRRGLLLIGDSGTGKSTLALHCALQGMDFLTEDATFVAPGSSLATGIPNFLHVKADSLRFLDAAVAARVRRSPVILRRSGVPKFELDVRRFDLRLAREPLTPAGVVFLSRATAGRGRLLRSVGRTEFLSRLESSQAYAASQPHWKTFVNRMSDLPAVELRRGRHPAEGVHALRGLLDL